MIRFWIALHRPATHIDVEPDLADVLDVVTSGTSQPGPAPVFGGGHSVGGGASSQWSATGGRHASGSGGSLGIDLDFDGAVG